ncbi:hypothetical protein F5144DRAFT_27174 [Chaetomium tenue]|uniref:Uncharacterized protein n=1 Tax=Chaetomium tenue TaxID=1854479 RepID=A0ACB7PQN1_9PEZI|nr:hypothetical protein F5144DRAFT_27174 [Chaetomium globosum]
MEKSWFAIVWCLAPEAMRGQWLFNSCVLMHQPETTRPRPDLDQLGVLIEGSLFGIAGGTRSSRRGDGDLSGDGIGAPARISDSCLNWD